MQYVTETSLLIDLTIYATLRLKACIADHL